MPDGATLAELQAEIETVAAECAELQLRIRRRELVELDRLKPLIIDCAHITRNRLLTAPVRQAATLAAARGLNPAVVLTVLTATMRTALTEISRGPRGHRT